jgi:pyocin large subunit-like protein
MPRHQDTQLHIAAVRGVTTKLHAAEDAIDKAIIAVAELNLELPNARINAKLSATVAQPAFDNIAGALASLTQGRNQTVKAHEHLAEVQREMGLGAMAMGDSWKIFKSAGEPPLALVEKEAA